MMFSVRLRGLRWILVLAIGSIGWTVAAEAAAAEDAIDFNSQVRPIISDRCFHCHGPDAQNQDSQFRMDSKENLFADLGGYAAVIPGDVDGSELVARIRSTDEHEQMPPPDSKRSLSEDEIDILEAWVRQGAVYQGHWAFESVRRPAVPTDVLADAPWSDELRNRWSLNPIDAFVARRLIAEGITPSPSADPLTRLRRASLTLTGMLPSQELQDRFTDRLKEGSELESPTDASASDDVAKDVAGNRFRAPVDAAYDAAIVEILGSMGYAERQTLRWLDAARYADTDGYQVDQERTNWPWRDWVIQAFHNNMPFDQFTIQQLAGDMLPDATPSQRLATAFNRNHRQNNEAGALAAEFAVENTIDRVETTATVWLGLTLGCARCHDHKYDPLSQREFYQFYGFFNNIGERGVGKGVDANPTIKSVSPLADVEKKWLTAVEDAEREHSQVTRAFEVRLKEWTETKHRELSEDSHRWRSVKVREAKLIDAGRLQVSKDGTIEYAVDEARDVTYEIALDGDLGKFDAVKLQALPDDRFALPRQLGPSVNGNFVLTDLSILVGDDAIALDGIHASFQQNGYPAANAIDDDAKSGWAVFGPDVKAEPVDAVVSLADDIQVPADTTVTVRLRFASASANHVIGKLRIYVGDRDSSDRPSDDGIDPEVQAILVQPSKQRSKKQKVKLRDYFLSKDAAMLAANKKLRSALDDLTSRAGPQVTVMVMQEREGEPNPAYLLQRGQYDQPAKDDPLPRGVPAALLASVDAAQPSDRMQLAKWLVSPQNPLTARVAVNRIWRDHFGIGLVKTADDFGLQGEVPSHPELLDWLAAEFVASGWDVQAMHRLIVTSAAFGQSSKQTAAAQQLDPDNRWIGRGPRYRADGFMIRDIALQAAELTNSTVGGPSVKPYQPDGMWQSVAGSAGIRYQPSKGDDLYRKSMYSYWKRAVNPPRQTIFDASGREVCSVQVRRTNTPLQALVLMNDPTFVESARRLAQRAMLSDAQEDGDRLRRIYRWAIAMEVSERELAVLADSLAYFRKHFGEDPEAAKRLLAIGQSERDESLDVLDLAAMTMVAHLIMNTDEFVTVQ
ncbi:Planctomycete cytochrome C [Rubripirellula lacrimiformis]|uniref:Planctomycete cytochrome C n=1 Tax=Rubripirellula lacrimiformis TaxID=1930273 RepID=A0A517NF10_9BACT|nr:PSD1 and planctomycete cytochrome C domain-containing protein [Rubripirellula lacrimiformis]QDT05716.1 Planctomycete cytochrome C [Rubripirellula lacrimiformis]